MVLKIRYFCKDGRTEETSWDAPLDEVIQFAKDGLDQNDADSAIIMDMDDTDGTEGKVVATVER